MLHAAAPVGARSSATPWYPPLRLWNRTTRTSAEAGSKSGRRTWAAMASRNSCSSGHACAAPGSRWKSRRTVTGGGSAAAASGALSMVESASDSATRPMAGQYREPGSAATLG
jgi:hypothetical protein